MMKASAYLSIFDDWSLLRPAVASIADRVDEIVVVDGAYEWMIPYFVAVGRDPARSDDRVREALAPFAAKLRWIHGTWRNESHKRAAGFEACRHRHVFRIDADEVLFFDDAQLDAYFAGDRPVAEMEMPIYAAPGLIRRKPNERIERQCMVFDRGRIGAREHLAYLWLVLPAAERAELGQPEAAKIHPDPVAFCAHLTHWRTPDSGINRARFYILNDLREGRASAWAPGFRYGSAGFAPFIDAVPPPVLDDLLMSTRIVSGTPDLAGWTLAPSPLSPAQEASFAPSYEGYLAGLAAANACMAQRPRTLLAGHGALFDISTPQAAAPFGGDTLQFRFAEPVTNVGASLLSMHSGPPWQRQAGLPVTLSGQHAAIRLPPAGGALRRTLSLGANADGRWLHLEPAA